MTANEATPHPPNRPGIAVGVLRELLADFPADWQVSADDSSLLIILDASMQPRGAITVPAGTFEPVDPVDDEGQ